MVPHSRHGRKTWKWPQRGLQMWHSHFRPAEMSDTHSTPHRHPKTHLCIQHGSHRFSPEKKLYLHNYDQTKPPHNRGKGNTQHLKKSKKHWQFGHPPISGWIQKPSSQWFYVDSLPVQMRQGTFFNHQRISCAGYKDKAKKESNRDFRWCCSAITRHEAARLVGFQGKGEDKAQRDVITVTRGLRTDMGQTEASWPLDWYLTRSSFCPYESPGRHKPDSERGMVLVSCPLFPFKCSASPFLPSFIPPAQFQSRHLPKAMTLSPTTQDLSKLTVRDSVSLSTAFQSSNNSRIYRWSLRGPGILHKNF